MSKLITKALSLYNEMQQVSADKQSALSKEYLSVNLESIRTWEGNLEDLNKYSVTFPMTSKWIKHLKSDVVKNYIGYLFRALIALTVIIGIPLLIVNKFPLLAYSGLIVGICAFVIIMNGKVLMKPNLRDIRSYNDKCKTFIIPVASKYRPSSKSRGIIVGDLYIPLGDDPNYFDFEENDTIALVILEDSTTRVHKI